MKKSIPAKWLASALLESGMSQAELARRLAKKLGRALDRAAVNKMAAGNRVISADELIATAQILGVAPPEMRGVEMPHISSEDVAATMGRLDPRAPIDGIPEIDIRAGMGGGGFAEEEVVRNGVAHDPIKSEAWSFPVGFVRNELRTSAGGLRMIETMGDSMSPTIMPGERVMIDVSHTLPSPDGLYAIRDRFGMIVVKRLQVRHSGRIQILSDNKAHEPDEVGRDEIAIVGRVVCGIRMY